MDSNLLKELFMIKDLTINQLKKFMNYYQINQQQKWVIVANKDKVKDKILPLT